MIRTILVVILITFSRAVFSQAIPSNFQKLNSIQLEMSGGLDTFVPFALNYERIVYQSDKLAWCAKMGAAYRKWPSNHQKAVTFEVGATILNPRNHFEFGLFAMLQDGIRYFVENPPAPSYRNFGGVRNPPFYAAIRLGYRLQTPTGKWALRLGVLQPFIMHQGNESAQGYAIKFTYENGKRFIIWPVLSVGRAF